MCILSTAIQLSNSEIFQIRKKYVVPPHQLFANVFQRNKTYFAPHQPENVHLCYQSHRIYFVLQFTHSVCKTFSYLTFYEHFLYDIQPIHINFLVIFSVIQWRTYSFLHLFSELSSAHMSYKCCMCPNLRPALQEYRGYIFQLHHMQVPYRSILSNKTRLTDNTDRTQQMVSLFNFVLFSESQ